MLEAERSNGEMLELNVVFTRLRTDAILFQILYW